MKIIRKNIFLIGSTIALLGLLAIQVNWIFKSARIKEELFNDKAEMVLSRAVEDLCADMKMCERFGEECRMKCDDDNDKLILQEDEMQRIDSLLQFYIDYYEFPIKYSFELIQNNETGNTKTSSNIFKQKLDGKIIKDDVELKLIVPDKHQFIMEEMGALFVCSVVLIVIVLIFFWITVRSLWKEKLISENTMDFLNNMTHEFKTPIANISLARNMLVKDANINNPAKISHYANIILDENEKLKLQVDQILNMAAIERGEICISQSQVDLKELIESSISTFKMQIEARNGKINFVNKTDNALVSGDKALLLNVVCNLIDNANKYSQELPVITLVLDRMEGHLTLEVKDQGIGISKENQKEIFNKFYRVSTGNVHNVKGFGIGLSFVRKILEAHGATIEVESELGKGSCFRIIF